MNKQMFVYNENEKNCIVSGLMLLKLEMYEKMKNETPENKKFLMKQYEVIKEMIKKLEFAFPA